MGIIGRQVLEDEIVHLIANDGSIDHRHCGIARIESPLRQADPSRQR